MRVCVTGGLGFIGSAVVRHLITDTDHTVLNLDSMGYSANARSVESVADSPRYRFARVDIRDRAAVAEAFDSFRPNAVMHLAAQTHVDRSIDNPSAFVETNVMGTFNLLEAARNFDVERFHHVSTDEVYGELTSDEAPFLEDAPYRPRSPYAASKAASDHFVRAWSDTYGLPTIVTNTTNNYGPFQFPEKLIPLMTLRCLAGASMPVYGLGLNRRDWIYVDDHVRALVIVLERGAVGRTYGISAEHEATNIDVVQMICDAVDDLVPTLPTGERRRSLVTFVEDRPGHDQRYAIDARRIRDELGWASTVDFAAGLERTVRWFRDHAKDYSEGLDETARQGLTERR